MRVRTSAKALVVRGDQMLVTENSDSAGLWYILPGGGQEPGETLEQALQRECFEEIGVRVGIQSLRFVREYIADNHTFHDGSEGTHQVDFIFECNVPADYTPSNGNKIDAMQTSVCWKEVDELKSLRFYPSTLLVAMEARESSPVYLGDVN